MVPPQSEALAEALALPPPQTGIARLAEALAAGQNCVMVWAGPAPALAAALSEGTAPGAALEGWQAAAQSLLDLHRRHRRRLLLLSEAALSSDDPATLAQMQARLGLDRPLTSDTQAREAAAEEGAAAGLTGLLAELAAPALEELRPLLARLEAASLYCPRPVLEAGRLDRAGHWLALLRARQDLLADQVRLDRAEADLAAAEARAAEAKAELERLRGEQAATRDETGAERALLHDQIRLMGQASEAEGAARRQDLNRQAREAGARAAFDAERAALQTRAAQAEADLAALRKDHAEALDRTAPCDTERALLREQIRLMGQASGAEEAERAAILAELVQRRAAAAQADQAVSRALTEARLAAEARARAEDDLAGTRAEAERLAQDLAQIHGALIARENELTELRAWAEAILASTSWKVTAPLRRASLMLGRHRG
jgi:hypothetical protein